MYGPIWFGNLAPKDGMDAYGESIVGLNIFFFCG